MKSLLMKILSIPTTSDNTLLLTHFILNEVKDCKISIDEIGNILVIKGKSETYPCVVSHLDTVYDWGNVKIDEKEGILSSKTGIGGDDKCGVFVCLQLLKDISPLKAVFFQQEEIGCKGSNSVDLEFFKDCRYIIGIDRRGNDDFIAGYVGSKSISDEFLKDCKEVLKGFNYKKTTGCITDSLNLASRKVGISCCNISCGFVNPHTLSESVVIKDVIKSYYFVEAMIKKLEHKKYNHEYKEKTYTTTNSINRQCTECKEWKTTAYWNNKAQKILCPACELKLYPSSNNNYSQCDKCFSWKKDVHWSKNIFRFLCDDCESKLAKQKDKTHKQKEIIIPQKNSNCELCLKLELLTYRPKAKKYLCDTCWNEIDKKIKEKAQEKQVETKSNSIIKSDNPCNTCEWRVVTPVGNTCMAKDDDYCPKEEVCKQYENCYKCPQFFCCNLVKAKEAKINAGSVKRAESNLWSTKDCEKCKSDQFYEPAWCEDCPKQFGGI